MRAIILFLIGCIASGPALAADQFDLTCKGTSETLVPATLTDIKHEFSLEIRIDLKAKRYCYDACTTGQADIFKVDDHMIELKQSYVGDPIHGTRGERINRVTGEFDGYEFAPDHSRTFEMKGPCELAPFKGFPAAQQKF